MHLDDFLVVFSFGFLGCEFVNSADVVAGVMMDVFLMIGGAA